MHCANCGKKIKKGKEFCSDCSANINSKKDNLSANLLCILSLFSFFCSWVFSTIMNLFFENYLFDSVCCLSPLVAIVLMVIARILYPKNKFAKILMWIYILIAITVVLFILYFMYSCETTDWSSFGYIFN